MRCFRVRLCVVMELLLALFVGQFVRCLRVFFALFIEPFLRCLLSLFALFVGQFVRCLWTFHLRCLLDSLCVVCGPVCALFVGPVCALFVGSVCVLFVSLFVGLLLRCL